MRKIYPKQTPENMRSLHEVNSIMDNNQNVSLSDVEINNKVSELDSIDEVSDETANPITPRNLSSVMVSDSNITPTPTPLDYPEGNINPSPKDIDFMNEGKMNPIPKAVDFMEDGKPNSLPPTPLDYPEGNINPSPKDIDFMNEGQLNPIPKAVDFMEDGKPNPLPDLMSKNPLENIDTEKSLTVETSKNLQVNKSLTFDLDNSKYTPSTPQAPTKFETNMSATPASTDNFDYQIPESLSANSGSARRMARKNAPPGWRAHLG